MLREEIPTQEGLPESLHAPPALRPVGTVSEPPSWGMVSRIDTPPWTAGRHQFPNWKLNPANRSAGRPSIASASKVMSEGGMYE